MIGTLLFGLFFPVTVLLLAWRAATSLDPKWKRFTGIGVGVFPLFVSAVAPFIFWRAMGPERFDSIRFGTATESVQLIPSLYLAWWGLRSRDPLMMRLLSVIVGLVPVVILLVVLVAALS